VSVCRISRPRPAPRQARTAISCWRDAPRARSSPARFAHASSSSSPTVAIKTVSGVESICVKGVETPSPAGSIRSFVPFANSPASGAFIAVWNSTVISARACSIETPRSSRANSGNPRP